MTAFYRHGLIALQELAALKQTLAARPEQQYNYRQSRAKVLWLKRAR